jgi:tetratricopeptide (TPR) repeat protein
MFNPKAKKLTSAAIASICSLLSLTYTAHGAQVSKTATKIKPSAANAKLKGLVSKQINAADKLMQAGKYAEAEQIYHDAINENSKDTSAIVGYGMSLSKQFKLTRADEEFDRALKLDPQDVLAHCGKATVSLSRLQSSSLSVQKNRAATLSSAEAEAKQALQIDPDSAEAQTVLASIYKEEGQYDQAIAAFQKAIELDPKLSEPYAGLGLVNLDQGSQADAEKNFKTALSLNTANSTAHYGLGQLYLKQGQIDQAISELNTSLYQFRNSAPVHLALGKAYEIQGNTVAAIKEYQESIRIKPENAAAYLNIANIRENRGDIEHAIAELRSGAELMQNGAELQLRIANDSLRIDKLDDAIKAYESVLAVAPRSSQAVEGLTRVFYLKSQKQTASAFLSSNDFEQADELVSRAIRLNPSNMQLRLAQAKLRSLSGQPVDLNSIGRPKNDPERISYAEALLAQNKFSDAAEQMNSVIDNSNSTSQLLPVADLALMIRDLDSAEKAFKKAGSMPGGEKRAARGLAQVAKARKAVKEDLTLAQDLERRKQYASSIDKFQAAIYGNPRSAEAHEGLAESLERLYPDSSKDLLAAVTQYRAYMALSGPLPEKEKDKLEKHIGKLQAKASKLEQKNKVASAK